MKKLFNILPLCFSILTLYIYGQTGKQEIQVLAKFVSYDGGDKIHFSKFVILKDFTATIPEGDTITVGYYFYKALEQNLDTVLLTLKKYDGQTNIKNYFICPDYDTKIGIQKAKIDIIGLSYWEDCEKGKKECTPLTFTRAKDGEKWFLLMPCGGTETSISVSSSDNSFSIKQHLFAKNCPPYLELTNLKNGKYFANMTACGLGGSVEFNLKTK